MSVSLDRVMLRAILALLYAGTFFLLGFRCSLCFAASGESLFLRPVMGAGFQLVPPAAVAVEVDDLLRIGHNQYPLLCTPIWIWIGAEKAAPSPRNPGDPALNFLAISGGSRLAGRGGSHRLNPNERNNSRISLAAWSMSSPAQGSASMRRSVTLTHGCSRHTSNGRHPASLNAAQISLANRLTSRAGVQRIMPTSPGGSVLNFATIVANCSSDNRLSARASSILTLSKRSCSAFWLASAARASASFERASASLARSFAAAASARATSVSCVSRKLSVLKRSCSSRAASALSLSCATSQSEMVCNRLEKRNIPPSANSSPETPIITKISNSLSRRFHLSDFAYSPTMPITSTTPKTKRANSDISRATEVAPFDIGQNVPLSPYDLGVALAMGLQGLAAAWLLMRHFAERRRNGADFGVS